jgi:hypothetical protein
MSSLRPVKPVNLFCGLISGDPDLMDRAVRLLKGYQGPVDLASPTWPFDMTDYYLPEMGDDLQRRFVAFGRLVDPGALAGIKLLTNDLERRICADLALPEDRRVVNLDPGYVTLAKVVLATTKDFSHRLYLGEGVYAESTLRWLEGRWQPWPWTYPDYASDRYHAFFTEVRESYRRKLSEPDTPIVPAR